MDVSKITQAKCILLDCLTTKTKAIRSFEMSELLAQMTQLPPQTVGISNCKLYVKYEFTCKHNSSL